MAVYDESAGVAEVKSSIRADVERMAKFARGDGVTRTVAVAHGVAATVKVAIKPPRLHNVGGRLDNVSARAITHRNRPFGREETVFPLCVKPPRADSDLRTWLDPKSEPSYKAVANPLRVWRRGGKEQKKGATR